MGDAFHCQFFATVAMHQSSQHIGDDVVFAVDLLNGVCELGEENRPSQYFCQFVLTEAWLY